MSGSDVGWHDRLDIFGLHLSAIDLDDAIAAVEGWIGKGAHNFICVTGVHGVMDSRHDATLRNIHNHAGLVTPDGIPLVWLSRLLGKSRTRQVCGCDLMRSLTAVSAQRGYRQFYYGGAEGVAERLKATLTTTHPGLQVVGTFCPPFRDLTSEEDDAAVAAINAARPDVVWVGLSTPKQEYWMAAHLGRLDAPVMIGVGAAFDFLAGTKRRAPVWMRRVGLEWLFRLLAEPRRLWRRYARIVPAFIVLAVGMLIREALQRSIERVSRVSSRMWSAGVNR
jgi:N-acetylglucosaminyldiphosphoundecaprenol N-acetyl-beta-D-mannosaminyltransferase